ncbi:phosphopyruvate hydratase [Actinomycetospora sp. CA-101289]|uniref:phosphopyruvate hydratase n=1 Tax=Actinomycetospora sp. CA-101289 TaxID=3239893 RepID=UPI003D9845D1
MTGTAIAELHAWEALDSRGRPTVAAEVKLEGGARGRATVPSGASTGRHEARELRDGGTRHGGYGVRHAVANVTGELADAARGLDATDQLGVDRALRAADGTQDLGRLGANAVLAVSVGSAVASAAAQGVALHAAVADPGARPLLPLPMVNIISGGAHAGRTLDVQDFLAVPLGATSFADAIEWCARVRAGTASVLADRGHTVALVADEGGLGPVLPDNRSALDVLVAGIERAGLQPGPEVGIAVDVAATQFATGEGEYTLAAEGGRVLDAAGLVDELASWCDRYPIVSIEDALAEDDWAGWTRATQVLHGRQLLGDDLFVTNRRRLERGIEDGVANAVLVKPNQIGTLSDARAVVRRAHDAGYTTVLSARSGETEDDWLADLAVGWRTGQIKVGSTTRSERTAKWNRLLQLESQLGEGVDYAGAAALVAGREAVR